MDNNHPPRKDGLSWFCVQWSTDYNSHHYDNILAPSPDRAAFFCSKRHPGASIGRIYPSDPADIPNKNTPHGRKPHETKAMAALRLANTKI